MKAYIHFLGHIMFCLFCPLTTVAQTDAPDSVKIKIDRLLKHDFFSIGALLQVQAKARWKPRKKRQNTFETRRARVKFSGNLSSRFGYELQADITDIPLIKDASISYSQSIFSVKAGAQKLPVSAENLTSSKSIDFIERSRVVNALTSNRDIGLRTKFTISPSLDFSAGMFNGSRLSESVNENNLFFYAARLQWAEKWGHSHTLKLGMNTGTGIDDKVAIGDKILPLIDGRRLIYGGDGRIELDQWLFAAEFLWGRLDYSASVRDHVFGYYLTGGYNISKNTNFLLRLDHFRSRELQFPKNKLLGGLNYHYNSFVRFQFNYGVNPREMAFKNHYWLSQLQVAF